MTLGSVLTGLGSEKGTPDFISVMKSGVSFCLFASFLVLVAGTGSAALVIGAFQILGFL